MNPAARWLTVVAMAGLMFVDAAAQTMSDLYGTGRISFVEQTVFGSQDDEDDGVLFGPTAICVDDDHNVFVLDQKMYCVNKYAADGRHLHTFSRKGEGPGEMTRAYSMTMTPGGNLAVFDNGNHRITVFDRDGEYVRSQGFQGWVSKFVAASDGSFVLVYSVIKEGWMTKGQFYQVARLAPDLRTETPIDSAYIKGSQVIQSTDNSYTSVGTPFVGWLQAGVLPDGSVVFAHGDEYRLRFVSPDGETVREVTRDVARVAVNDEDKEKYFGGFKASDEDFMMLVRKKLDFPEHKPYIGGLFTDDTGHIFVQTFERTGSDETRFYDVFTPDGSFVNRVEMPTLEPSAVFRDDRLYMIKSSEDELPVVVCYRPQMAEKTSAP